VRYFFYIAYKGSDYHGWQIQPNVKTVQQVITDCMTKILREPIEILGSGRTDTGVHASEQVFHCDINGKHELEKLMYKLNGILPPDIAINKICPVIPEAHARFDAYERSYVYKMHQLKTPFFKNESAFIPTQLDFDAMNKAAELLLGNHNFQCFSKIKTEVNNFICDISLAKWEQSENGWEFKVTANRFLRGMVRAIVGTLIEVGEGKLSQTDFFEIIKSKDRRRAGKAVPAEGLYLCAVKYIDEIFK